MSSKKNKLRLRQWLDYGSIRFRLTALYVTFFGATLIIFSSILYNALIRTHQRDFDIDLYNYTVDVASGINLDATGEISIVNDALTNEEKIIPFTLGSSFVQLLDSTGNAITRSRTLGSGKLPLYREDWSELLNRKVAIRTVERKEIFKNSRQKLGKNPTEAATSETPANIQTYRLISYPVTSSLGGNFILQIAAPTTLLDQAAQGLRNFLLFGIPITLFVSTFAGYYFASQALNPVKSIIAKAKQLTPGNLSERIPLPVVDDELKKLTLTLNDLLDRLQQAFDSQERFIADASHELKTPLAILRGELDLMQSRSRSQEEILEFVNSASQDLEHLSSVVEDLLLLARVDAGRALLTFSPVRLDEEALEAISRMEILARKKEIKLRFELQNDNASPSEFQIDGDADLLRIMMKNLIENAIKFSPAGSTVEIRLLDRKSELEFSVRDQGPGIPDHLKEKIFDRFFRIATKENISQGAGLGLAIVCRIVQAHHGKLNVVTQAGQPGSTFRIILNRTD
jgi:signal transduction histidine kinase